ncbi:threonine-phosphate decarboxylase CobD [Bacillus solitudinis]|uniref:threonine-phosphate decarboxylase CobD n=1 Tax=Bacillus solitudinis TaxID=2014074 RepID=UPI000C2378C2|nr:threonine-phosphate decarboxylase CobD [Bacillus solitudinis]
MSLPNHGANPIYMTKALGVSHPDNLIDFSVNTNPYGPPPSLAAYLNRDLRPPIISYPDPQAMKLSVKLAQLLQVDLSQLIIGNGAAELIFLLANHFQNQRISIIEPAFSEYRDACEAYGCKIQSIILSSPWELSVANVEESFSSTDVLFLCTPNNPTGVIYKRKEVLKIIKKANELGITVVIDEAFYDFSKEKDSYINLIVKYDNLIILRSLTKMYSIAGLRLGYLATNSTLVHKLKKKVPPWNVNGLAQEVGQLLLEDQMFVKTTVSSIKSERERVIDAVSELGFFVSNSSVNFFLLYEPSMKNLDDLLKFLVTKGIIARHTYNFRGLEGRFLRFAIKTETENDVLINALSEWRAR